MSFETHMLNENNYVEVVSPCGQTIIYMPLMNTSTLIKNICTELYELTWEPCSDPLLKLLATRYPIKLVLEQSTKIDFVKNADGKTIAHFIKGEKLASIKMQPNLLCIECADKDFNKCKQPLLKALQKLRIQELQNDTSR